MWKCVRYYSVPTRRRKLRKVQRLCNWWIALLCKSEDLTHASKNQTSFSGCSQWLSALANYKRYEDMSTCVTLSFTSIYVVDTITISSRYLVISPALRPLQLAFLEYWSIMLRHQNSFCPKLERWWTRKIFRCEAGDHGNLDSWVIPRESHLQLGTDGW